MNLTFKVQIMSITRECEIGKQKYRVTGYYDGDKNINDVIENLAISKALYEYNYESKNDEK